VPRAFDGDSAGQGVVLGQIAIPVRLVHDAARAGLVVGDGALGGLFGQVLAPGLGDLGCLVGGLGRVAHDAPPARFSHHD